MRINIYKALSQTGLAGFSLAAMYMALSGKPELVYWAPVVGLAGQPFWTIEALRHRAYGQLLTVCAYTGLYFYTIWNRYMMAA